MNILYFLRVDQFRTSNKGYQKLIEENNSGDNFTFQRGEQRSSIALGAGTNITFQRSRAATNLSKSPGVINEINAE